MPKQGNPKVDYLVQVTLDGVTVGKHEHIVHNRTMLADLLWDLMRDGWANIADGQRFVLTVEKDGDQ